MATGMAEAAFAILADRLPEPCLLVAPDGTLLAVNAAAGEDLGAAPGQRLADLAEGGGAGLVAYLRLCATSAEPLPGALDLKDGRGFRVDGFAYRRSSAEHSAAICLRLRAKEGANATFAALNEKIAELSREVRARMATEARLRQALGERDVLIRELHHRIRNTLQVLASLASIDAREAGGETRRLLEHAGRAKAVGIIYRHLYGEDLLRVRVGGFLTELAGELADGADGVRLRVEEDVGGAELELDRAVPFALLVHDLTTIGLEGAMGRPRDAALDLRLHLTPAAELRLEVHAPGAAAGAPPHRTARERLVRRLAAQVGGTLAAGGGRAELVLPCAPT